MSKPPTILYVHHRPELGGAPTSLYHLLQGLDRSRYRPVVMCPPGDTAKLFATANVPVYTGPMATFTHVITSTYHGLRWLMVLRELARAAAHVRALRSLIRRESVALVHLNEGNLLLAAWVARRAGVRVVCHFRGMLADGHWGMRKRLIRSALARWADRVLAIDGAVARPLGGLPNLRIVHNSVDLAAFGSADGGALRAELGIPAEAPVAGMVGRVRRDEGSLDFLQAAALVQRALPEAWFVLVGGGTRPPEFFRTRRGRLLVAAGVIRDDVADAEALASRLGVCNVLFVPYRRDTPAVYAALDLVVSGGEAGIGRQALEAAAASRPIIAASHWPVPDLVAEGVTGHVVTPGDVDALATRIREMLGDEANRRRIGEAARERACSQFDPAANARRVMAIYGEVLRGGAG